MISTIIGKIYLVLHTHTHKKRDNKFIYFLNEQQRCISSKRKKFLKELPQVSAQEKLKKKKKKSLQCRTLYHECNKKNFLSILLRKTKNIFVDQIDRVI